MLSSVTAPAPPPGCAVLYSFVLAFIVMYCSCMCVLYSTLMYSNELCYFVITKILYCIILNCDVLFLPGCTLLFSFVFFFFCDTFRSECMLQCTFLTYLFTFMYYIQLFSIIFILMFSPCLDILYCTLLSSSSL